MSATQIVEEYYEALRRGDPLAPYFAEREDVVKFGISERLAGYEAVAGGLREQTRTTADWRVESRDLRVTTRGSVAWFTDDVGLSWTATADGSDASESESGSGARRSFDTRWSGVLERVDGDDAENADWQFTQMHVSAPHDL